MILPPIPYESRTLRVLRQRHENIRRDRKLAEIALEIGTDLPPAPSTERATLVGDEAQLRGIPVVGVKGGHGGAIRGSRPGDGLD